MSGIISILKKGTTIGKKKKVTFGSNVVRQFTVEPYKLFRKPPSSKPPEKKRPNTSKPVLARTQSDRFKNFKSSPSKSEMYINEDLESTLLSLIFTRDELLKSSEKVNNLDTEKIVKMGIEARKKNREAKQKLEVDLNSTPDVILKPSPPKNETPTLNPRQILEMKKSSSK
jgi:hypothetical protein